MAEARLLDGFFQQGYVTNDLERAMDMFRKNYGIKDYTVVDASKVSSPETNNIVANAWVGDVQIELICANGPWQPTYAGYLPENEFAVRFHHNGYATSDPAQYHAQKAEVLRQGLEITIDRSGSGVVDYFYTDARPTLGFFMEHVLLYEPAYEIMKKYPQSAPRHSSLAP